MSDEITPFIKLSSAEQLERSQSIYDGGLLDVAPEGMAEVWLAEGNIFGNTAPVATSPERSPEEISEDVLRHGW